MKNVLNEIEMLDKRCRFSTKDYIELSKKNNALFSTILVLDFFNTIINHIENIYEEDT